MSLNDREEELGIATEDVSCIYAKHTNDTMSSKSTRMTDGEKVADAILTLASVIRAGQIQ